MIFLLLEALAVGLFTGIIGLIISTIFMFSKKDFSLEKYTYWKQVFASFFITGIAVHLICEFTGINKWYCKNGNACKV